MNIVSIIGSPRVTGNSATIAKRVLELAVPPKHSVKEYILNELNFKGCQACMACKLTHEECIVRDDLTEVLNEVRKSDVLVLATPIYFGGVTSQTKAFIDRTFSFLVPNFYNLKKHSRLSPGKKLIFITTQGQKKESTHVDIFPKYSKFLKWYGFDDTYVIKACGVDSMTDILSRPDIMQMAELIGKKLFAE